MSTSLTIVPRGSRRNGSQGGSRRGGNRGGNRRGNRRHGQSNRLQGGGGRDLSVWMSAASADLQKRRKTQNRQHVPQSKPIEVVNAFGVLDNLQPARKQAKHNPKPVPKVIETPLQPQGAWGKVSPATLSTPAVQKKVMANVKTRFKLRTTDSHAKQQEVADLLQDNRALAKRLRAAEDLIEMQEGTIASLKTENRRLRDENADLQDTATAAVDQIVNAASNKGILKAGGIRFKNDNPETMMNPPCMTLVYNADEKVDSLVTGEDAAMVERTRAKQVTYLQKTRFAAGVKQNPANAAEAAAAAAEHHRELMAEQVDETKLFAKSGGAGAWKPKRKRVAGGGGAAVAAASSNAKSGKFDTFEKSVGEWGTSCCEADDSW